MLPPSFTPSLPPFLHSPLHSLTHQLPPLLPEPTVHRSAVSESPHEPQSKCQVLARPTFELLGTSRTIIIPFFPLLVILTPPSFLQRGFSSVLRYDPSLCVLAYCLNSQTTRGKVLILKVCTSAITNISHAACISTRYLSQWSGVHIRTHACKHIHAHTLTHIS